MDNWQVHATFDGAGEMYFGLKADSRQEARDSATRRLADFGLPVGELEVEQVKDSRCR